MRTVLFFTLICLFACKNEPKVQEEHVNEKQENVEEEKLLIGKVSADQLLLDPYADWYTDTLNNYSPAIEDNEKLKNALENVDIEIFFGTWCSDSQREVPAFHKIMNHLDIDFEKYEHIALDRDKVEPGNLHVGKNIEFVPTFIFYRDSIELGRIVEMPMASLEEDMLDILMK